MAHVIERLKRPGDFAQQTLNAQLYEEFRQLFPERWSICQLHDYYQPEAYIPPAIFTSKRRLPQ
jgi:excinuclease UvrABC helicase subunit UvrB